MTRVIPRAGSRRHGRIVRSERAYRLVALILSALVGLALGWLHHSRALEALELRALDGLMAVRSELRVDPRIRIVELDEATLATVGLPQVLWRRSCARVAAALLQGGARVVLLDSLFPRSWHNLPADSPLALELEQADLELGQVLLSGQVVLIDFDRGQVLPRPGSSEVLHYAADSRGNVALANLLTDPDGVVRRLPLYADEAGRVRFVAGRLAELAENQTLKLAPDRLELKDLSFPIEAGSLRVNYPGPGGLTFPSLSFARLLRRVEAGEKLSELAGSIVLIGPGALQFQDFVTTPIDRFRGRHTAGVEVHAAGLNTLLTGAPIRRASAGVALALVLGLGVLGGLWSTYPPLRLATLGLVLSLLALTGLTMALLSQGLWIPVATGSLSLGGGWLIDLGWRQATLERSRRQLKRIFGRFVSPQVMQTLLQQPANLALGGRRARITVLFCDINNFTPTCEGRPPEEVITMLNRFFQAMVEVIFAHGGTVKQFAGDEIMVLYGAPDPAEDHAARAVRTALAMVARLNEMREQARETGFYEVKIGIHTGDVVVGNVGSEQRSEYAAVGDPVNLAARIESLAKSLGAVILVSDVTRHEAGLEQLSWRSLGLHHFKGKQQEMQVWEVEQP